MSRQAALVVDDEPDIRELLTLTLTRLGLLVDTAGNVTEAKRRLAEQEYAICLTDFRMPDGTGMDLVEHVAKNYPKVPIAIITAYGSVDIAVGALKAGAFDFVSKPVDLTVLRRLVQSALKLAEERKAEPAPVATGPSPLLGNSAAIEEVRQTVAKVARSQAPVYITGESGSGKELVARQIHELGPRASGAFVPVNCGAIPGELMESEFFGHKKGSFTGAAADKDGLFQAANGGTLFLDEVADLPMHMQVKLLRVIQEKAVRPIGARQEIPVDVRVLSATHKNLARLVEQGAFRQDLFYRINVIEVRVPPLRERREDIPLLAGRFLDRIAPDWGVEKPQLSARSIEALKTYDFPGNVRELENILERAVALCENSTIEPEDMRLTPRAAAGGALPAGIADPKVAAGASLDDYIDTLEREALLKALQETRYNKTAAAKNLGITFRALRYKLKKLGIE
ncbi:MAG TPA: sigma-54 dependent transcriptional regulator [Pseudomonadota bacterium]|nr:sigma-54-dependent Fis family transcriptional regulator [Xanthomonadales bacterium]HQY36583.1 sigma-54 dependent transcriptional regulator [Pseudomonadota bacterium]HRA38240.1 sigma-54 dependent transcriptional regulator [Pseudomonadota bacterium]